MTRKSRTFDYLAVCRQCNNQFTLYVWATPDPNAPGRWIGEIQKSRDLQLTEDGALHEDGLPRCRCGGALIIYGEQEPVRIVR
jgi:hypothetical protein